jgi:hypothetical protein
LVALLEVSEVLDRLDELAVVVGEVDLAGTGLAVLV